MERTVPLCLKPAAAKARVFTSFSALAMIISALLAAPAAKAQEAEEAEEKPEFFTISGNVALVSDYRFRGVSLSDEDAAIQGGISLNTAPGFFIGTWASSIETFNGAETELDLYAGYGFTLKGFDITAGVTAFLFPGGQNTDYVEPYVSVGRSFGAFSTTFGAAYAPDQSNIGNNDNIDIYNSSSLALGDTPFSINGTLGYEDGAFGDNKVDWSLGLSGSWKGLSFSAAYVDTSKAGTTTDATVVFSIGMSF
jgi:uncharacterized protein (TIGR02001 family)